MTDEESPNHCSCGAKITGFYSPFCGPTFYICKSCGEKKERTDEHPGRWPKDHEIASAWAKSELPGEGPKGWAIWKASANWAIDFSRDDILKLEAENADLKAQLIEHEKFLFLAGKSYGGISQKLEAIKAREVRLVAYALRRFAKAGNAEYYAKQYIAEFEKEENESTKR